ncbi:histamine H2 receptor-like [Oculina patagonica]
MTNTSHNTGNPEFTRLIGVPWMVVQICEAVLILAGNSITVYIFWSIRKRLKRTSYLLINLAIADILVGIAITLFLLATIEVYLEWGINYFAVAKTASAIDLIGTTSSVLSLALISLERMLAILWPFRHRLLNIWCYHVSVGFIWLISSLNMFLNTYLNLHATETENVNISILTPITFITSVIIISGAYLAIWISTRRNKVHGKNTHRQMEQSRKLTRTLFVMTALSIITCLPYGIILVFKDFIQNAFSVSGQIIIATQYANSFLNPVVYCFKMPEFKESLRKLFCRCAIRRPLFNENESETSSGITLRSFKAIEI